MPTDPTPEVDSDFVAQLTAHQQSLQLYVRSLLPGDPSAQDIAQQANATIWKKRTDFTPGTHFKAWTFAIARFEVLTYRKKQARDSRLIFSDEMEEIFAQEIPEQTNDQHEALKTCLQKLTPKNRDLLLHRYTHRTPLKEYAQQIGRTVGTLKVTLHRLRQTLQSCIQKEQSRPSL